MSGALHTVKFRMQMCVHCIRESRQCTHTHAGRLTPTENKKRKFQKQRLRKKRFFVSTKLHKIIREELSYGPRFVQVCGRGSLAACGEYVLYYGTHTAHTTHTHLLTCITLCYLNHQTEMNTTTLIIPFVQQGNSAVHAVRNNMYRPPRSTGVRLILSIIIVSSSSV